ncbi:MAG: 4-vinyl reductase [Anaerolineae bacterium]|nr:4-vinyl reductase [Anaerolineae bacterium]
MALELSGFYYPNKMARIYVLSIEETIGSEAMRKVYDLAGVPHELYPPPNNFAKAFDFAYYAGIGAALEKMYGLRGERGLALHAGRASFSGGLAEFGAVIGVSELSFKAIPLRAKLKVGLKALAETFSKFSDVLADVTEADDHFIYTIRRCPGCWGRSSDRPICYNAVGVIEDGLRWLSDGKSFAVEEVKCRAAGDEACVFHIRKDPLN